MNEVLLPYQSKWAADSSKVKIWEKSRRIGASYGEALLSVLEAAKSREANGQNTYYLSYNKEMTQGFIKDCAFWAKVFNYACDEMEEIVLKDEDKDITVYRIRFASGYEIWGMPSEPRSLRSKQGRVIIDEAAFVENLSELLKAALALLMWGGSVSIISTHNGDDNAFNELIKDVYAGKFRYSLHRTTIDDALACGLYQKICEQLDTRWTQKDEDIWRADLIDQYGEGADEELYCVPNKSSGAYLTASIIEACMQDDVPVLTWIAPASDFVDWAYQKAYAHTQEWLEEYVKPSLDILPSGYAHFLGEDFGRSGDLTIMWVGTEMQNLDINTPFVLELRNCPHRTQEQILKYICDNLPNFSGASFDARGNGSALAEYARQEYGADRIAEVMISEKWYRETMPLLKARIEDKTISLPKNADIKNDLRSLKVVKGVARIPDKRGTDSTGKRHGDAAIALGMLVHAYKEFSGYSSLSDMVSVGREEVGAKGFEWGGW